MAKIEIEGLRQVYLWWKGRIMELDRVTSDSALYGKRCAMCKARCKVGDPVLAHFVPGSLVLGRLARELRPRPAQPQAEDHHRDSGEDRRVRNQSDGAAQGPGSVVITG